LRIHPFHFRIYQMTDLSVDARLLAPDQARTSQLPSINRTVVGIGLAILTAGALALDEAYGWRQGALFVLGGALGLVLYHALFGFTSAWRVFIADGRGAGLRAQMLMLAVAAVLFFPALGHGTLFGEAVHGEYGAVGVSVLIGAFVFGTGMQLGGGCAPGTLYTAGSGNTRMLVTLAAFIIGAAIGALHLPWWSAQPNIGTISLIETLGWALALAISLAVLGAIALLTRAVSRSGGMAGCSAACRRSSAAGGALCRGHGRSLPAQSRWRLETSPRCIWPAGRGA
jgi:uncharacterized protein